jgi:hypothetical protein
LGLSFFGLTSSETAAQAKINIYKQIHQICFHGKGGYSWPVVYNMPVYLRRFIFNELKQFYDEEKSVNEKANKRYANPSSRTQQNETQTFHLDPSKGKSPVKYQ